MNLLDAAHVEGLPEEEHGMLRDLLQIWSEKQAKNRLRMKYYSGKNRLKDLGISIPPPLKDIETVVGWPAKAVDALALRSRFDGFTFAGENDFGINDILAANKFKRTYRMATLDELINCCSFITVSKGGDNEPDVIVSAYTTMQAAADWDMRGKCIKCGLTVVDMKKIDEGGVAEPVWVNLYTKNDVWEIKYDDGEWTSRRNSHNMGRPLMEPLSYRATLERPFGRSRITRAVRSITDSAVRCALRTEVTAEFFTAPQRYVLGADDSLFKDNPKWEAYIGTWLALTKDEDGDFPRVGQFAAPSVQPHTDYMRSLAARFAGETGVPISELGVIHDNPASAEAIYAAKETLVIEAETLNEDNGEALKEIGKMVLAISQDKKIDDLTDEEKTITPRFKNPARPSLVSQADAIVKAISAVPFIAESNVALEELGFNEDQITRLNADKAKAAAQALLQSSMAGEGAEQEDAGHTATMYEVKSIIQSYRSGSITRKDAINLFEKIGIDEAEADSILAGPSEGFEVGVNDENGAGGRNQQSSQGAEQTDERVAEGA